MSEVNVEIARLTLAWWIEVDEGLLEPQRLDEFFAPNVVTTFSGFLEEATTLHGHDQFLEFRTAWMETFEDFSYEAKEILDAGASEVVVMLSQRGKPHGGGPWVEMDYGLVYTMEDGVIIRADFYAPPEKADKAAGVTA